MPANAPSPLAASASARSPSTSGGFAPSSLLGSDARLSDCRRLFLRDYEVLINIGVHAAEKTREQRVLINVDLYIPLSLSTPTADELDEVVDYDFIRSSVAERVGRGHIHLQETLCDDLLATLLAHPKIRAARVSTEKPDVYPDCASVGCEVFGIKAERVA